jgi:DNA-binding NarL/FixJ family response regulator
VAGLLLGADDYVVKPFFQDELLARVRRLIDRTRPPATEKIGPVTNGARLTDREQQVLSLLAAGLHSKAIATRLVISPKTVATHIQRILAKLGVHSRAEAVALAFRSGLAQPIPESSLPTSAEEFSPAATTASG